MPAQTPRLDFALVAGDPVRAFVDELLELARIAFGAFDPTYLNDRMPHVADPSVTLARAPQGALVGFKLGYRRGGDLFYSWLGAVDPDWRRRGIAQRLMAMQHDWARQQGYRHIETRTRQQLRHDYPEPAQRIQDRRRRDGSPGRDRRDATHRLDRNGLLSRRYPSRPHHSSSRISWS